EEREAPERIRSAPSAACLLAARQPQAAQSLRGARRVRHAPGSSPGRRQDGPRLERPQRRMRNPSVIHSSTTGHKSLDAELNQERLAASNSACHPSMLYYSNGTNESNPDDSL